VSTVPEIAPTSADAGRERGGPGAEPTARIHIADLTTADASVEARTVSVAAPVVDVPEAPGTALPGLKVIAAILLAGDACSILIGLFVMHLVRDGVVRPTSDFALVLAIAPIVWIAIFQSFGLYGVRHLSAPEEFRRSIGAATIGILLIMVGSVWWQLDRRSLALAWAVTLLLELAIRRGVRWYVGRGRRTGRLALRTLIVGSNGEAAAIGDAVSDPVRGFLPLGFVSDRVDESPDAPWPVLGRVDDLPDLIRRTSAECVFVASTGVTADDMYRISRCCRHANIEMRVSANATDVLTSRVTVHQVHDLVVLAVRSAHLTRTQAALKRVFDLTLGTAALVSVLPLMGVLALAVKLTSPGPVLFRQERVTKDGRRFTVYKFRTMIDGAERHIDARVVDLTEPFFKMEEDPRLTRVGRRLRSWSLDELPQLVNVIRGDMSLVGPRPLAANQVEGNEEALDARHEVRAGLTGWWQINGRSDVEPEQAVKMDLFYIENWSLTLDLYILLKTVGVVLTRKGAL